MDFSTMTTLSRALDYGSARLQALSGNLSNVNTPGYKRRDVSFASLLDDASGDSTSLTLTNARHIPADEQNSDNRPPAITATNDGPMRSDGNSVDIDAETARLAAAQIHYEGVAQLMAGQFSGLKYAISGGK